MYPPSLFRCRHTSNQKRCDLRLNSQVETVLQHYAVAGFATNSILNFNKNKTLPQQ